MATPSDRRVLRELARRCQAALLKLLEAYTHAQALHVDVWPFAVEIKHLREAGLADHDLRRLALQGYVKHAVELRVRGTNRRAFRDSGLLHLTAKTCVVLTASGAAWVRQCKKAWRRRRPARATTPHYDRDARELRVGSRVVKHFRQPAPSQEWLLLAFQQQQNWRTCIDIPPLPKPGLSRKKYLHDTLQNLNRHQKHPLIRFYGDGSGRRVCWEWRR